MTTWKAPGKPPEQFPAGYFAVVEELAKAPAGSIRALFWDYEFPEAAQARAENFRYWRFCLRNHGGNGLSVQTERNRHIRSKVRKNPETDRWQVVVWLAERAENNPALAEFA